MCAYAQDDVIVVPTLKLEVVAFICTKLVSQWKTKAKSNSEVFTSFPNPVSSTCTCLLVLPCLTLELSFPRTPEYVEYKSSGDGLTSSAQLTDDGRIVISLDLKKRLPDLPKDHARDVKEFALDEKTWSNVPAMNILIMIVGSRGGNSSTASL
jgi:hypothetical protein